MDTSAPQHPLRQFVHCPMCGGAFRDNDEKSRRCAACGFIYYFNPAAATVAVIRDEDNRLLVVRRAKDPARGTLDLPGGFCDCCETAEQGVIREVREETGLEVEDTPRYLFSQPDTYLYSGFVVHTVDSFFECRVRNAHSAQAMDDAGELMWLRPDEIDPADFGLDSIREGIRRIIQDYQYQ